MSNYVMGDHDGVFLNLHNIGTRDRVIMTFGAALCNAICYVGFIRENPKVKKVEAKAHKGKIVISSGADYQKWLEDSNNRKIYSNLLELQKGQPIPDEMKISGRAGTLYQTIGTIWYLNQDRTGLNERSKKYLDMKLMQLFDQYEKYPHKTDPFIEYFSMMCNQFYAHMESNPGIALYNQCFNYWLMQFQRCTDVESQSEYLDHPATFINVKDYAIPLFDDAFGPSGSARAISDTSFRKKYSDTPAYIQTDCHDELQPRMVSSITTSLNLVDPAFYVPKELSFRTGVYIDADMPYGILFVGKKRNFIVFDTLDHCKEYMEAHF